MWEIRLGLDKPVRLALANSTSVAVLEMQAKG